MGNPIVVIDPESLPAGWFDPNADPQGWFDPEIFTQASAGPAFDGALMAAMQPQTLSPNRIFRVVAGGMTPPDRLVD